MQMGIKLSWDKNEAVTMLKDNSIKTYVRMEERLHAFLISAALPCEEKARYHLDKMTAGFRVGLSAY